MRPHDATARPALGQRFYRRIYELLAEAWAALGLCRALVWFTLNSKV